MEGWCESNHPKLQATVNLWGYLRGMKVLIMGGSGMLGHKMLQRFANRFDTYVTLRQDFNDYRRYNLFKEDKTVVHITVEKIGGVIRAIDKVRPDVVVNCIGIVKQATLAKDPLSSISVNALFPHLLARYCQTRGIRIIQISTDCVFSGHKGFYNENDISDAEDIYGKTKFLGELSGEGCLTLRTSIVGRELETSLGLIEWLLSQEGKTLRGYANAIFSGLTTGALADIIGMIIADQRDMKGVWHVASEPISKLELLSLVKRIYKLNIQIERDDAVVIDRSLNANRFCHATGFVPSSWHDMIEQMYMDPTPYEELRRRHAKG
jgi:dTDP-4-dehydrorhamnose reductase